MAGQPNVCADELTNELNKLRKQDLIDILVKRKVCTTVQSQTVINFFNDLFKPQENETFHDTSDVLNEGSEILRKELACNAKLITHLEKRVEEQSKMIEIMYNKAIKINISDRYENVKSAEIVNTPTSHRAGRSNVQGHDTETKTGNRQGMDGEFKVEDSQHNKRHIKNVNNENTSTDGKDTHTHTLNVQNNVLHKTLERNQSASNYVIKGTSNTNTGSFAAAARSAWLYVGNVSAEATDKSIKEFLMNMHPNQTFSVDTIEKKHENRSKSKSFKVGFDFDILDEMIKPENWPKNVVVRRYRFFRSTNSGK